MRSEVSLLCPVDFLIALSCQLLSLEAFLPVEVAGVGEMIPFFTVVLFFPPSVTTGGFLLLCK